MTSILILQHQRPDGEVDTYHLKAGRRYHLGRGSQCQVRILDLKLSRQHCAFEARDDRWMLVDLASTNGCSLDGTPVSGSVPVRVGSVVSAGTTSVTVASIIPVDQEAPDLRPGQPAADGEAATPLDPDSGPPAASERLAAAVARSSDSSSNGSNADELEPHAQPNRAIPSDPLIPAGQGRPPATHPPTPPPVRRPIPTPDPTPAEIGLDHDVLATMAPGFAQKPEPNAAAGATGSRTFYISVLGRRVGPLSKVQARELKTRELKGTLTASDLAAIEAIAASQGEAQGAGAPPPVQIPITPAPPHGDEQATYYITLLGRRVGPMTRSQARELKARELRGLLTEADIAHLTSR